MVRTGQKILLEFVSYAFTKLGTGYVTHVLLWVAFAVFLVSIVAFVGLEHFAEKKNRIFHYISSVIALVATVSLPRSIAAPNRLTQLHVI